MKTLYYNCPAGLCGDMNLGAMVDLGVNPEDLRTQLKKLGLEGWQVSFSQDERKGISGTRCDVIIKEEAPAPLAPLSPGHGHHVHRTFKDIREMIEKSSLEAAVKKDAISVFKVLAEAEGAVHGKPVDDVHFHEVGAVDSILDIVGAAICWNLLGVDTIAASTIELGGGTVQCAHGRMPVPAPATAKLVKDFPVSMGGTSKEATTPTGAALLAGMDCQFNQPVSGKAIATGIGIGQRNSLELANVVYVSLLDSSNDQGDSSGPIIELVTNLDDMTPEHVAFLAEELMAAGSLDVWQTPATFKKGRLGCVLSALVKPEDREKLTDLILHHSTTLGVRWRAWDRTILEREQTERETSLGKVRIKSVLKDGHPVRSKIEFDDLSRLARENNLSLSETEDKINE
jgi:uncharacterized protein (TIGR00299 family) protein